MGLILPVKVGVAGFFKIEAFQCGKNGREIPGSRHVLADWFPNMILNQGLDLLMGNWVNGGTGPTSGCHIGYSNVPVDPNQTALIAFHRGTGRTGATSANITVSPYYGYTRMTYRFDPPGGAVGQNYQEVAVANNSNNGNVVSRALIVDAGGTATSITVLPNEYLDVSYEIRQYPPLTDVFIDDTALITGTGTTHDVTIRASRAGTSSTFNSAHMAFQGPNLGMYAYTGVLGPLTGTPAGNVAGTNNVSSLPYTNGNYYRDLSGVFAISDGSVPFRSIVFGCYKGEYQAQFDPAIPKDLTKQLNMVFRVFIARRDPL